MQVVLMDWDEVCFQDVEFWFIWSTSEPLGDAAVDCQSSLHEAA